MSGFKTPCRFNAVSGGLGSFVVASAVPGFKTPAQAVAKNGLTYRYHAQTPDGLQFEDGEGVYTTGNVTLTRASVFLNSLSTLDLISFTTPPEVDVFPSQPEGLESIIPTGSLMLFQQTTAPIGWTKQTTHNDKVLRVVSGAASAGGTYPFSSIFYYRTSDGHAITIAEMPSHNHDVKIAQDVALGLGSPPIGQWLQDYFENSVVNGVASGFRGGNAAHSHTFEMSVQYVDLIIATKD